MTPGAAGVEAGSHEVTCLGLGILEPSWELVLSIPRKGQKRISPGDFRVFLDI